MGRIRVIPVLLMKDGGLVKSVNFKSYNYIGDPINAVRIFNEKEVDELVLLDISATKKGLSPNIQKIADIASQAFMPMAYGGGISTLKEIKDILYNGIEKVVINTSALDKPELIKTASEQFGSQSIVVSIDVKNNLFGKSRVYRNNGSKKTSWDPIDFAKHVEQFGAGEIMLTAIDKDGTFKGFDLELINKIASAIDVPLIACGGASSIIDFKAAVDKGASAVAAGSMFVYAGRERGIMINYPKQKKLKSELFDLL